MALTDKLTAIADAIRGKTGKTDGLTLDAMPGEITGIQTGGDTSVEDGFVTRTLTSYSNDRVTTIGNNAFNSCGTLSHIELPKVTKIGASAFAGTGLKTANFPKLESIGEKAFQYSKLEQITADMFPSWSSIPGSYAFGNISTLKYFQHTFTTVLQSRMCSSCSNLEKVDVCSNGLSYYAFSGCLLNALILRRTDAICELGNKNAIENSAITKGTGYIYVPSALIEEYKVATNWSLYVDQFRAIEDYPDICEVGV